MRNFDTDVAAEILKEALHYFCLLEFQFNNTYRYTDRDASVFYNGNRYYPLGFKFNNVNLGSSMAVDSVTISIDNTNRVFSGILLNEDCRNKTALISFGVRKQRSGASGSVTIGNMKLSLASGSAFVDFSSAGALAYPEGSKITITDSAGKKAVGYIKAAGAGETYGSTLNASSCENHPSSGFNTFEGASATGFHAVKSTSGTKYCGTADELVLQSGKLYLVTMNVTTSEIVYYRLRDSLSSPANSKSITISAGSGQSLSGYFTNTLDGTGVVSFNTGSTSAPVDCTVSNLNVRQVLTPSVTGVTIVSQAKGSVQNWESIDAGFKYYDLSGYTYTISEVPDEDMTETLFTGLVAGWTIQGDSTVEIEIVNEFILWNKKTLRRHPALCPWTFKGQECTYAGSAKDICDKTYDTCLLLGNQSHFGGFRWIPIISDRKDWWGRTRGYSGS